MSIQIVYYVMLIYPRKLAKKLKREPPDMVAASGATTMMADPHLEQNLAPSVILLPHVVQAIMDC